MVEYVITSQVVLVGIFIINKYTIINNFAVYYFMIIKIKDLYGIMKLFYL